jgi:hypothetical protein
MRQALVQIIPGSFQHPEHNTAAENDVLVSTADWRRDTGFSSLEKYSSPRCESAIALFYSL